MADFHIPFWQPWGAKGCLWRTLVFLAGLCLICLMLALLLRGCGANSNLPRNPFHSGNSINPLNPFNGRDTVVPDPYRDLPPELRDTSIVNDWNETIPDIPELPPPSDNYIPPVDSTDIITSPEDPVTQVVSDQLVVFFNSQDVKQDMISFARQFKQIYPSDNYKILYYNPAAATMLLGVPQNELTIVADELPQRIKGINFLVTTNTIMNGDQTATRPSDPGFNVKQYEEYYKLIQAYEAWGITRGSRDVKVAIVDSYFDLSNPEIGERYTNPINIGTKRVNVLPPPRLPNVNSPKELYDYMGLYCHGSHVAGLAIGGQNNTYGCSGIAPECSWIPVALGDYPWNLLKIYEGVLYAIYHGADVVNMSLGTLREDAGKIPLSEQVELATHTGKRAEQVWEFILATAASHNCVIVKAAGNETALMGMDFMNRSKQIVNVEAVDNNGQMAEFSNFGVVKEADLHYSTVAAPGVKLWSSTVNWLTPLWQKFNVKAEGGFQEMEGTSMAAPVVAGAVALLKSKNKDLTADQVVKILALTGKQTDTRHRIGPTLQIKDALDATGGDLANFDDIMQNHDLLLGKWRSTHELVLTDNNKNKIDELWSYFLFSSAQTGVLEDRTIATKRIYKARFTVKWEKDKFIINQLEKSDDGQGHTMKRYDYVCVPDENRLLKATCYENGKSLFDFQLEKVN